MSCDVRYDSAWRVGSVRGVVDAVTGDSDKGAVMPSKVEPLEHQESHYRNAIWWLASYPKSGSTWVRLFVNCAITKFPVNLNTPFQYVLGDLSAAMYQSVSGVPLGLMGTREIVYLRPAALINRLAQHPQRDVCLKTHNANMAIDDVPLCPERITRAALYIVRDPRDVVISWAKHLGLSIDETITIMADESSNIRHEGVPMSHFVSSWSRHVKSWLSNQNGMDVVCVRYEDMLATPVATFSTVVEALGLQDIIDDGAFQFALEQTEFSNLKQLEQQDGFRERGINQGTFFNRGVSGGWRDVLTTDQARRIEDDHGEMMEVLDYELEQACSVV